ncbi:hypothetical protein H6G06_25435 [Anabaena sphaerica FACHB-251]|uniref:Uncharacterized protein n=1 Tax=Anabaena sphaerica FACHB-251 TaxID=2692883 RepID=A0A927A3H8_9NOST|nr:hypothetical protein [Anabaena sphaerica]MBD2296734.1 hypothetical protein [Anabaena sphaerica FACHB-251]
MENTKQQKISTISQLVVNLMYIFAFIDFVTTLYGIYEGVPSLQPIKIGVSIILSVFITSSIYCLRIILKLEDPNIKKIFISATIVCIFLDGWTSYEGIHHFIKPVPDDYFGWMLFVFLLTGCVSSPVLLGYREEINNKLQ